MQSGKKIGLLTRPQKLLVLGLLLFCSLYSYTSVIKAQNPALEAAEKARKKQEEAAASSIKKSEGTQTSSSGGAQQTTAAESAADIAAKRAANMQKVADVRPSQKVNEQLERIFPSSETIQIQGIGDIQPWKDAKVMMKATRDSQLELEIKAMNFALYLQGLLSNSTEDDLILTHFGRFCAGSSANEGGASTFNCQSDAALQYADIMPSGFEGFRIDPDQEAALIAFIKNLVNPFPSETMSDPNLLTPEKLKDPKNRKVIAQALAEQTAFSVARQALTSAVAKRRPIQDLSGDSKGKSFMEILEKEASKEFLNDGWQQQMKKNAKPGAGAGASGATAADKGSAQVAAALYEAAPRQAFNNFMLYQNYRELEQIKILLAVQVAILQQQAKVGANVVSTASSGGQPSSK